MRNTYRICNIMPAAAILLGAVSIAAITSAGAQQTTPRQSPPPLGTPKAFHIPPRHDITLPNGMKVTLVQFGKIPKASVYLETRTGRIDEAANEVWLSDVTADMLREGTTTRSATQIAEDVAGMGGDLSVSAGTDMSPIGGAVLAERAADMVRLVADVAQHPVFPDSELGRIKANELRNLALAKSQPQSIAAASFEQTLYGNHPYGRVFPTDSMLGGYTIQQVRDFYTKNFGAARSHLYVVGVFDPAAVERAARDAFGAWSAGSAPTMKPPTPNTARSVTLIDRPGAVQSTLILGLPVPGPNSADYMSLNVMDALLGGSFGSRITSNIREQKGYTYSPFSIVDANYHDANWSERADVTTPVTGASLKEIFGEISRLQDAAPGDAELTGIKNNMIGLFTLRNASRGGIINQLAFVDEQGLGDGYLADYVPKVLAVTPAEVQRVARTYLQPDHMTLVVVGDKKTVDPQLAPFRAEK
jgi:zinc protease